MELTVNWDKNMRFMSTTPSGHEVTMDASEKVGGNNGGPRPTELLLNAVGGCTGIDIISILKKMRLEPTHFRMEIKGEQADEHPKSFTIIHIHYILEGDLPSDKVERAIELSVEKYCTVAHSLNSEIKVSYSLNENKN